MPDNDSNKTTTTTNNAPWSAAQPLLKTALNHAKKEFMRDPRGQKTIYTDSTVVPWSYQTNKGMGLVQGNAFRNSGDRGLSRQYQDIINQGGLSDPMKRAMGTYNNVVDRRGYNGATRDALSGYNKLQADPFNSYQDAALRNTQRTANSKFDLNANPAFQQVLQQAQNSARDSVNMSAGGAGRYGGAVHQGNLASEVGDLTARMVGDEYRGWQNRRDAANSNLFNMGQTGVTTQMGANAGIGNLGQNAISNMMSANNARAGLGQQAIGNLGTAYQGMQQPAQDYMQLGAMNEDLATRQMNDKLRVFNEKNNATWNQISKLNAIASGAGQLGGTQTTAQPGQNPWLTGLGYGATGLGLLGGLF